MRSASPSIPCLTSSARCWPSTSPISAVTPLNKGTDPFRTAAGAWLSSRFKLPRPLDPENEILVLNGSREGLFLAAIAAARYVGPRPGKPAILMPNPFYPVYGAGARAAACEPVYLPTTVENGFLPDLDAIDEATLARTVAFYLASPANPQGSVAKPDYFRRLKQLADRYGFVILSDECYSEIYTREAPGSALECAGPDFTRVVAFQSLSKRSNLPGLRVGFAAGDKKIHRHVPRAAQHRGAAGAGAAPACRDRCLWRRGACRGEPQALPDQVRSRRPDHRRSLRLSPA